MVHEPEPGVNYLYCWRDLRGLVHLAPRMAEPRTGNHVTRCGKFVAGLTYAGREDVSTARPSCVECVRTR